MRAPPGLQVPSQSHICKLRKSLYGLKQASRQWYEKLSIALKSRGFSHSLNDNSLFLNNVDNSIVIIAVYVDDILVTGDNEQEIHFLKEFLDDQFRIKDLGFIHFFLGLEFNEVSNGMVLHQHKFILDLLRDYHMENTDSVNTPLPTGLKLVPNMDDPLEDPTHYRQLVGKLNFLLHTRPDMSSAV